jgi:hypothetical protein
LFSGVRLYVFYRSQKNGCIVMCVAEHLVAVWAENAPDALPARLSTRATTMVVINMRIEELRWADSTQTRLSNY